MERTVFKYILLTILFALAAVTAASAQSPGRASGIDSLGAGGDLGGNTEPPVTPVRIPNTVDKRPERNEAQLFSLSGRALTTAPHGQIVILRRRTLDGYVTEKKIMK